MPEPATLDQVVGELSHLRQNLIEVRNALQNSMDTERNELTHWLANATAEFESRARARHKELVEVLSRGGNKSEPPTIHLHVTRD